MVYRYNMHKWMHVRPVDLKRPVPRPARMLGRRPGDGHVCDVCVCV